MAVFFSRVRDKRLGDYLREAGVSKKVINGAIEKQKRETECYCTIVPTKIKNGG